ncbi:MAG: HEAT repeat domain-containing protein [Candidatus Muiribacteriota bacterium]|jgi:HEAT repeat protein
MNIEEFKSKIFSENTSEVYSALNFIEENPVNDFGEILVQKLQQEKNIFIIVKILEIVAKIKNAEIIKKVFYIFRDNDDNYIKATLVKILTNFSEKEFVNYIKECLYHKDSRVRANAVEVCEKSNMKEFIPVLVNLLKDSNSRVKINAARALYYFGDKRMLRVFEKLLDTNDTYIQESVVHTLYVINNNESYEILKRFFLKTKNERLLLKLLDIFGYIGKEDLLPEIRKLSINFNKKIAELAEYAMSGIISRKEPGVKCGKCGAVNNSISKFCGSCGNKI